VTTVEIDREKEAAAALDWFRRIGRHKFAGWDSDLLESAANLAVVRALDKYKPDSGASIQTWCKRRIYWDLCNELRYQLSGYRGKLKGRKKETLDPKDPMHRDAISRKDRARDRAEIKDTREAIRSILGNREMQVVELRSKGYVMREIGEMLSISESRVSQIIKEIRSRRLALLAVAEKLRLAWNWEACS